MRVALTMEEREARVRRILAFSPTASNADVASATGYVRETVRRVRFGLIDADVLPELPRLELGVGNVFCHQCVQWGPGDVHGNSRGRCALGIPECSLEGTRWARVCSAFHRGF